MLTLDLPVEPYWLDLPRGVRVEIRPVTTAVMAAAQAGSARRLGALRAASEALAGSPVLPRERTGIFVGMEPDPEVARWGTRNADKHSALAALSASLDHVVPHSRGGSNEESNLVTACNACQFGRGQWTLEEVGFIDPREFKPALDAWDGLTRLGV